MRSSLVRRFLHIVIVKEAQIVPAWVILRVSMIRNMPFRRNAIEPGASIFSYRYSQRGSNRSGLGNLESFNDAQHVVS